MDEVDDFLAHYGVKGMHWGKRKSGKSVDLSGGAKKVPVPRAEGYTPRMQKNDFKRVGKEKGIEKVHQKVADGVPLKKARDQVMQERYTKRAQATTAIAGLAYTAYVAGPLLKELGGIAMDQAILKKQASNGRKHSEKLFSDKMGIANYPTIHLSQNPTTGNWV